MLTVIYPARGRSGFLVVGAGGLFMFQSAGRSGRYPGLRVVVVVGATGVPTTYLHTNKYYLQKMSLLSTPWSQGRQ